MKEFLLLKSKRSRNKIKAKILKFIRPISLNKVLWESFISQYIYFKLKLFKLKNCIFDSFTRLFRYYYRTESNPASNFKLPPPPTINNELFKHPRFNKQNDDLPPPPVEMLSTTSLPPISPPAAAAPTVVKPLTLFQQKS